jgi:NAD+ synthetase
MQTFENLIRKTKAWRNFHAGPYIDAKLKQINDFFRKNNLDAAVVGISGGVDSAVVLGLLMKAKGERNSPIKKVLALSVPIKGVDGVSGQRESHEAAYKIAEHFEAELLVVELQDAYKSIIRESSIPQQTMRKWAEGQMASILRVPVFYYHAAVLQTYGYKSIVVGTTNRDEGSYIGYFGKTSDAAVDLQFIADIHKSEVRAVAKKLKLPDEIAQAPAKGDVWDGKSTEEMMQVPYWFLEMYLLTLENGFVYDLTGETLRQYLTYAERVETLHQQNLHKYQVGAVSHFLDVMARKIPGGWS